jgi:hypothetical protein
MTNQSLSEGLRSSPARPECHQWQPIETAPRDGRMLLLYPSSCWTEDTEFDYEVSYWDRDTAAFNQFSNPDDFTGFTHWMALPPKPGLAEVSSAPPLPLACPTCQSPDRDLHPLTGRTDDEVKMCRDPFHLGASAPPPALKQLIEQTAYAIKDGFAHNREYDKADVVLELERLLAAGGKRNEELLDVAHMLDDFQRHYDTMTMNVDRMPGNDLYSGKLMTIVRAARAALASSSSQEPTKKDVLTSYLFARDQQRAAIVQMKALGRETTDAEWHLANIEATIRRIRETVKENGTAPQAGHAPESRP